MKDARFEELLEALTLAVADYETVPEQATYRMKIKVDNSRAALVAYFEERVTTVMERLDVMRDGLENGMQENEDGTYTVIWTKRQLETAKKEAKRLYDKLFAEPDELPTVGAMGHGHD